MREVDPKTTSRAMSYEYYINAPMPMVTIFKTMDVTHLVKLTKKDYTFGLKEIKRAKTKPYTADVFDGADLIGSISFKVKGKTATVKDDFDFGDEF